MGTTAKYGYPYPEGSDPPAGHTQIQALAEAVDTQMGNALGQITKFQFDTQQIPTTGSYVAEKRVDFPVAFKSGGFTPVVVWSLIDNGYPVQVTINNVDATGFNVKITAMDGITRPSSGTLPGARTLTYIAIGEQA